MAFIVAFQDLSTLWNCAAARRAWIKSADEDRSEVHPRPLDEQFIDSVIDLRKQVVQLSCASLRAKSRMPPTYGAPRGFEGRGLI